jgi:hypothetical protein
MNDEININKKYVTRSGQIARIYTCEAGGTYPVHGAVWEGDHWAVQGWTKTGRYFADKKKSNNDLIEVLK